jgi:hypothetical protein
MTEALRNAKNLFWEALVISLFIFGCGLLLGYFIEANRVNSVESAYSNAEINLLDIQNQMILFSTNIDCELAIQKNIEFGDKIYQEALTLEKYDDSSQLSDGLIAQQKKFSTLRVLFFLNSINIRDKCPNSFDVLTYFYKYHSSSVSEKTAQTVFSNKLIDLKQKYGNKIILIPISSDLSIDSVDILMKNYKINGTGVLVNKNAVISSVDDLVNIEQFLNITN